jgi:hypothetical protein
LASELFGRRCLSSTAMSPMIREKTRKDSY